MNRATACIAACTILAATFPTSAAPEGDAAVARLESKWGGVMTRIRGWGEEGLRQFREGYRDYPVDVLEKALAARTFEKMQETLDAHAAIQAQQAMGKAMKVHAVGQTLPEDADNPQVAEAKGLVAKSLGDDARDLVFIPITPCTVWDTRFATNPDSAGAIGNAQTKKFFSHLDGAGGSYAAYGGNPTCPETAQNAIGLRPFAVMMTVYISDATVQGWLTFYRDGDADPSLATVSVYYSPGPTRTQTVISKSGRGYTAGAYDIAATSRFGSVNASASITGYFVKVTDGYVTSVAAAPPLASTGGTTPTIGFAGAANGTVLATQGGVTDFTDSPALAGSISMAQVSTPTAGNIMKGGMRFLHSAASSVFLGLEAGNFSVVSSSSTGVGTQALRDLTTASNNTAVGFLALRSVTTAHDNTAVGSSALNTNITGTGNTAMGVLAAANAQGTNNTAIGNRAFQLNNFGNSNIALGYQAGIFLNGSSNIMIGHVGDASDNTTIRIGTPATQNRAFLAGVRGVTTGSADAIAVLVDSNGQLGTVSSSATVKDHIADMGGASDVLMKLRPVTFQYKAYGPGSRLQFGLIAEEVDKVYPGLVARRPDGSAETVMYQFLPPMLLNEYQKQQRTIEDLKEHVGRLESALGRLQQELATAGETLR